MFELVVAQGSGSGVAGAVAINNELKAFAKEYHSQQRARGIHIGGTAKRHPKSLCVQRSYKTWLTKWKVLYY